ncbi:restriction endonuclease subunit S [uncultured Ruminococcus sp.]|uniref:restriction endonuclease subunit S n=1 Tax=Ruminococcus sp. TaxID=41978 RepID=UPI002673D6E0|nr:restriction endonuclease subunit S [uncultured Ruminococcus sp.]
MSNNNKTPAIRFKGFTDTWEQRELGDEAIEILAGGDIDKSKTVENGKYPIYANALTNDGVVGYYDDYYRVKAPAVTVTGRGEVGFAQARMVDFTPVVRLLAIRSNHDCCFLENAINNHKVVVESTGVPQLTVPQLSSYNIFFPKNIEEETRIGEYFRNLDRLITLHQRKYDKLIQFKAAMLQKMFPQNGADKPEIRFKGFTDAWEQRKLGELVEFYNGDRSSRYPNDSDMVSDGVPFINAGDLVSGRVKLDTANKITEEKFNELSGAKIQRGDIIYCLRGTLGKNAFVDNFDVGTVASSLVDIRPKKVVGKYLFQVLNSDIEYTQRTVNDEGAAQPNLSAKNLSLFNIPMPDEIEQEKIAAYFDDLDRLITLHQRKCDKYKSIKAGLIRKLFP